MKFIFQILFLAPIYGLASVNVAFLELRTYDGKVVQLEPNGQFAHMAISYHGNWLHSHPYRGVEIISQEELEKIGNIKAIVAIPEIDSLNESLVDNYLGKPYDSSFSWSDDKIYCSELIAKILKINPLPMKFESKFWPEKFHKLKGKFGISPDDIFKYLKKHGYQNYYPIR